MNAALGNFAEVFGDVPNNNEPAMFVQGQKDCKEGVEPQSNNPSYIGGYGFQYEVEQINNAQGVML